MDFVRSVTLTVAIRAAPQHTRTDGMAARFQFSVPKSEDALVANPDVTSIQSTPALTPLSLSGAPADRVDNGAVMDDPNDGKLEETADCADGRVHAAMTPELKEYVQGRVDAAVEQAVEHAVEEAVERAMEIFCEWELGGHIREQLSSENAEDRDAFEQLEARVDELEDGCNRVDSDDLDEVKRVVEALSCKVDALRTLTETLGTLHATCNALVRRVTELELTVTSRAKQETTTTRTRSRKRAV